MKLTDKYQVVVILNPYDTFEKNKQVRFLLGETWGMKLRGYKAYFPYGVLPNDHLDYICNHWLICRKEKNGTLTPISGIKNITVDQCQKFKIDFPIYNHLFKGNEENYGVHIAAIKKWISTKQPHQVAYSMGFTIDPDLEKDEKKFICDLMFNFFYFFYTTYQIPNVIHGISKRFKLDVKQFPIGFNILSHMGRPLSPVKTKAYDNVESDVMVLDNGKFLPSFIAESMQFKDLWESRVEILPDLSSSSEKKAA